MSGAGGAAYSLGGRVTDENRDARERLVFDALDAGFYKWDDLVAQTGLAKGTIAQLRKERPAFEVRMEQLRDRNIRLRGNTKVPPVVFNPTRRTRKMPDFVTARMEYLGFPTPQHQMPLIEAWEDKTNRTILCLGPTGMGKDTTAEHLVLLASAPDWGNRCAWFMESDTFAKRRVMYGIRPYLEEPRTYEDKPDIPGARLPERSLIDDYGPFAWEPGMVYPDGSKVPKVGWNQNELYYLPVNGRRERDPNVWATGLSGATYGSRIRTMVVSDAFNKENQRNPSERAKQRDLLEGTMKTRLDGKGRRLFINTRVSASDNNGYFIDKWAGTAKEVAQPLDGPRSYMKLRNGVAIVIIQAITYDHDGNPESFWEDNPEFPLHSYFSHPDRPRERIVIAEITDDEFNHYSDEGYERTDGLLDRQLEEEDFETMQQQNPPATESGEFTDELLGICDDPTRTYGVYDPEREVLIQGVDPAKTAGAGWGILALDWETGHMTVVDWRHRKKLGHVGIREELIIEPLVEYRAKHLSYETNREGAQLEFPEVARTIKAFNTKIWRQHTGNNKHVGEAAVSRLAWDMRRGVISFPTATPRDQMRTRALKQQFKDYDDSTVAQGRANSDLIDDDAAIAVWLAWIVGRQLRDSRRGQPEDQRRKPTRPVPAAIRNRHRRARRPEPAHQHDEPWDVAEMMR